jgi:hypothetical protein
MGRCSCRTDWPNSNPAAGIILPHLSPDSIGRVKLSISPAFSFNENQTILQGRGHGRFTAPEGHRAGLGTSGVKSVLVSANGRRRAEASCALTAQRPRPLWPEWHPADWMAAVDSAMRASRQHANDAELSAVGALAIAGLMHGAVLLDRE